MRDALASAYIHRMKRAQARLLIGTDDAARAEGLRAGQALLARATGDVIPVTIPDTTAADITHVAALLTASVSPVSPPFPPVSAPVSGEVIQKRPGAPAEMDPARVEAVREAVQAGMAQGKILEQVWAVKAGGGAAYQAATEEYRAILAWLVQ